MSHQLDDLGFITRFDPKGMYRLTCDFPQQCRQALDIARQAELSELALQTEIVALAGMGGSAAGGDVAKALFEAHAGAGFVVCRDYQVPNYMGVGDIVFVSSYSGNTEETLSAYASAKHMGSKIVVLTSGGKLAEHAEQDGYHIIRIPGGQPPRTALGYMAIPIIVACERLSLLPAQNYERLFAMLEECVRAYAVDIAFEQNPAKQLAQALQGGVGILYGLGSWQSYVAWRWKGQINENAKNLAFANAFPELNHNEILGWVKAAEQGVGKWVGVMLEDGTEGAKMQARAKVTAELIGNQCEFHRARARGESLLEKMLTLTLLGDFVSLYLAALNGVDPENIDHINSLKAELAKIE